MALLSPLVLVNSACLRILKMRIIFIRNFYSFLHATRRSLQTDISKFHIQFSKNGLVFGLWPTLGYLVTTEPMVTSTA